MKEIPLTQGEVALVDDEDYEWLNQWRWYVLKARHTFYAVRFDGGRTQSMHREIMCNPVGKEVDHSDMDGLNNQRINLRIATRSQNHKNVNPYGVSAYLGVSLHITKSKYFRKKNE